MCDPLLISVGLGAAKAVSGMQEQNRAHAAQVAAVERSNTMARQKYINDLNIASHNDKKKGRTFEAQLKAAAAAKTAFHKQRNINALEAARADTSEQMVRNEKFTEAMFESQANLAKSIQAQGTILASGMSSGQSMMLSLQQAERDLGFEQAQIDASLYDATRAYGVAKFGIDLDRYSADTAALNSLPARPVTPTASFAPVKPIMQSAPSKPSILGPLISGVSTTLSAGTTLGGDDFWQDGNWKPG